MVYNIFISHSWSYSNQYNQLLNLLNSNPCFQYKNYSVPFDDPVNARTDRGLKEAIADQMSPASCILILAGVYATYSKWINIEIDLAKHHFATPKKIIAISPWGSERISTAVRDAANQVVGWNTTSIINAIREV